MRCYHCSNSTPINLLIQLTPMFEVDPLFKRTFLLALPICDLGRALERNLFELHEVCWTLARVVEERDPPYLSQEEVTRYLHFLTMARSDLTDDRTPPSVNLRIGSFAMIWSILLDVGLIELLSSCCEGELLLKINSRCSLKAYLGHSNLPGVEYVHLSSWVYVLIKSFRDWQGKEETRNVTVLSCCFAFSSLLPSSLLKLCFKLVKTPTLSR